MTVENRAGFKYLAPKYYLIILSAFYLVGIIAHLIPETYPLMLKLTPFVLVLSAFSAFYPFMRSGGGKTLIWGAAVFIFTFFIEAAGTASGIIFGSYTYGDTLGLKILGVPPVIALNWVLVIAGLLHWLGKTVKSTLAVVLLSGLGAVLFDFIMEPVAVSYSYWTWAGNVIPIRNYISWAVIAALAALLWTILKPAKPGVYPGYLLIVQFVFFLVLRISFLL